MHEMTSAERVDAVASLGFTERQAAFLVTVLLHGGVCVGRQYCTFAGIARGEKQHQFFGRLVTKGYARSYSHAHRKALLYHRCSQQLLLRLKRFDEAAGIGSTTRLRDWYGTLIRMGRRHALLFIANARGFRC